MNKNAKAETIHPFGKTYKVINDEFYAKINSLMTNHPDISKATIEWECNFTQKKKLDDVKLFFEQKFFPHCLKRLKPRDTVRGAFSDSYALKWTQTAFPNENFFCADVNGLYSFCAIKFKFMTGKYRVLIGKDLNDLSIVNHKFVRE